MQNTAIVDGTRFYAVVARDTLDQDYAAHRQRFLAEQGYAYRILDADDILAGEPIAEAIAPSEERPDQPDLDGA